MSLNDVKTYVTFFVCKKWQYVGGVVLFNALFERRTFSKLSHNSKA